MKLRTLDITLTSAERKFLLEAGYCLGGAGRVEEARAIFAGLLPLCEDKDVPLIWMGRVHFALGEHPEAIACYRRAVRHNPDSAFAHALLGEAFAWLGQRDEAERAIQRACELDPDGPNGDLARKIRRFLEIGLI